ncbi:MAG: ATP-binding protein [Oligoflexales bacterium]
MLILIACVAVVGIFSVFQIKAKFIKIRNQNAKLEVLMEERTKKLKQKSRDIENMLKYLEQGIFMIDEHEIVHHEYSAFLENILDTKSISGNNAIDLLFNDSNLPEDDISAMHSAISLILGEKPVNFRINQHFLKKSIEKKFTNGSNKNLEINWNAIVDEENNIVDKLLVSVRDVTQFKKLKLQADIQRTELLMVGELLECGPFKANSFFKNSQVMANSAFLALESLTDDFQDNEQTNKLFDKILRNLHTVKGNSRTLKFSYLTEVIHRSEVEVKELRKYLKRKNDQYLSSPQFEKSETSIEIVRQTINSYLRILREKLSSRENENPKIIKAISDIEDYSSENMNYSKEEKLKLADHVIEKLKFMRTDSLKEIIVEIADNLQSTATELGIDNPGYIFNVDETIRFTEDQKSKWENILIHCLINSLDHGLAAREDSNFKGIVFVDLSKNNDTVEIRLSDNGRGLNLDKLKKSQLNELSDYDAAMSIFQSGLSTKETITKISGQGIGMEAVKNFIERLGGSVRIDFSGEKDSEGHRPFKLTFLLPMNYFSTDTYKQAS